jgi:hypothetical protein
VSEGARGASLGCPSSPGGLHRAQDAASFLLLQAKTPQFALSLCGAGPLKVFHTATGLEIMPGVVSVIQTFGDRINFHPHIHVLVTEGGIAPNGAFHHVCRFHDEAIDTCHLKITFQAERPLPSHVIHQELLMVAEEKG